MNVIAPRESGRIFVSGSCTRVFFRLKLNATIRIKDLIVTTLGYNLNEG